MVWNASRPADSDRIRLSAGLIRDNWMALENGTVPFDTISLQSQASFPSLAGHNRLYGFNSAVSGNIELRSVNSGSQSVQLTENGKIGALTQDASFKLVRMTSFTFEGNFAYTGGLMNTSRGSVSSAGVLSMGFNIASSRTGTGIYVITIPAGTLRVNSYQVLVQCTGTGSTSIPMVSVKPAVVIANPTEITVETFRRSDGSHIGTPFEVMIVGGR